MGQGCLTAGHLGLHGRQFGLQLGSLYRGRGQLLSSSGGFSGGSSFELPDEISGGFSLRSLPVLGRYDLSPQQLLAVSGCCELLGRIGPVCTEQRSQLRLERFDVAVGLRRGFLETNLQPMNTMLRLLALLMDFVPEGTIYDAFPPTARVKLPTESLIHGVGFGDLLLT